MPLSIRSSLVLFALAVAVPALVGAIWLVFATVHSGGVANQLDTQASGATPRLLAGAAALLLIAAAGGWLVSRRLARALGKLQAAAQALQSGELVKNEPTGITDCDEVQRTLADATRAMHDRQLAADAAARTGQDQERAGSAQRVGAMGRLTRGVMHDFNNQLGIISNNAHLLQDHANDEEAQALLASTLRAVENGSQLTQHLLRFASRRPLRAQRIELTRYLPELLGSMRSMLGSRVAISVNVEPGTAAICVDPGELELALINLGLNARDAMPRGGGLRLHAKNAEAADLDGLPSLPPPRRWARLTVADDGAGVSAASADRVPQPSITTNEPGQGQDPGLSQVNDFCRRAGGTARVSNLRGLGTTVTLLLPSAPEPGQQP